MGCVSRICLGKQKETIGKEGLYMEQDGQIIRGLCYACFSGQATPVSEKIMAAFANAVSPASVRIEKAFVEKGNKKAPRNRPEWNALLEECHIEGIDYVVIPAMSMLSYHLLKAVDVAREIQKKYGINIHFLYEDVYTGSKGTDQELYADVLSAIDYEQRRKNRLKSLGLGYTPLWEDRKNPDGRIVNAIGYFGFLVKNNVFNQEKLLSFFRSSMPSDYVCVKDVYSDRGRKGRFSHKEGWKEALASCADPDIGLMIISSIDVIGENIMDVVSFTKQNKERNGVEVYFLMEDIYTGDKQYEAAIALHCAVIAAENKLNNRKEKMKAVFREIEADYA